MQDVYVRCIVDQPTDLLVFQMFLRYVCHRLTSIRCLSKAAADTIVSHRSTAFVPVIDTSLPLKLSVLKRTPRKKRLCDMNNAISQREEKYFPVSAVATADWYDLDRLKQRFLATSSPFQLVSISNAVDDVLCIQIASNSNTSSEAFIFDDGAVVFWNVGLQEEKFILNQVRQTTCNIHMLNLSMRTILIVEGTFVSVSFSLLVFLIDEVSDNRYPNKLILNEKEVMNFTEVQSTSTLTNDVIRLNCQSINEQILDKYTFSNALALSVKLGSRTSHDIYFDVRLILIRHLGSFTRR
jgi:uncharacterized Rmd1/YagE family protein